MGNPQKLQSPPIAPNKQGCDPKTLLGRLRTDNRHGVLEQLVEPDVACGQNRREFEDLQIRRILLNIHIHAGLLCFSGLLVLGISTLILNHTVVQTPTTSTTWSQPFPGDRIAKIDSKSMEESRAIREQNNRRILHTLGLFAVTTAEPDGRWTDADTHHAHFTRLEPNERGIDFCRFRRDGAVRTIDSKGRGILFPNRARMLGRP